MSQLLRKYGALIPLAFWLVAYLIPLGWRPMVQPEELRHAEIAREILVSGDWIVHTLGGFRYFDQPPLAHWANAISLSIYGENAFAVRFASCLSIGLIALALAVFTRQHSNSTRAGLIAGIVLLSSPGALAMANYAFYEGITSLWLTLCLLAYYQAIHADNARQARLYFGLVGAYCGLAFLTKGFAALSIPIVTLLPYTLWERKGAMLLRYGWIIAVALLCVTLPWSVMIHLREPGFWQYFLVEETWQEWLKHRQKSAEVYWMYLPLAVGFPWVLMILGKPMQWLNSTGRKSGNTTIHFCVYWLVTALLMFFLSRGTLILAALFCLPPLAVLLGVSSAQLIKAREKRLYANSIQISVAVLLALLLTAVLNFTAGLGEPVWRAHETVQWVWLCAILCTWIFILRLAVTASLRSRHWFIALGVAPAFALVPLYLPELIYAGRMPGVFMREQASSITPDTVVATDATLLSAASWYFKRTDVMLVGSGGEYSYALDHESGRQRFIEFADFQHFIERSQHPVAYFEKFSHTPPTELPSGADEGAIGRFILYRRYPGVTTPSRPDSVQTD